MLIRQALLAAILVSATAAAAVAQSDQYPFRRFATRNWVIPRFKMQPYRFSMRDGERFRAGAERLRFRMPHRNHENLDLLRLHRFDSRDMAMRMRNRAFARRDESRRDGMELRSRELDRVRSRIREGMDHFRFERPIMRRRSGMI